MSFAHAALYSRADMKRQSVHRWDEFHTPQKIEPTIYGSAFCWPGETAVTKKTNMKTPTKNSMAPSASGGDRAEQYVNPSVLYTAERGRVIIERFDTLAEAMALAQASKHWGLDKPAVVFDLDAVIDAFKEAKREEWGILGGCDTYLLLDPKTGEVSFENTQKGSGPGRTSDIILKDDSYVTGKGPLDQYLDDMTETVLREEYWAAVRDELDKILVTDKIDDQIVESAFQSEDNSDGHGGSISPEDGAKRIKNRIIDSRVEDFPLPVDSNNVETAPSA